MSRGLRTCVRIAWRRSRLYWTLWVITLASMMPATATQYDKLFPPGSDPAPVLNALAANPAMRALLGPAFDLSTKGGFVFWRVGGFTAVMAAMMAGFGIIRATRAEEETGRLELVRSGPVAARDPLTAAIIVALGGCLATGTLTTALTGLVGLPWPGAAAAGAAITLTGALFVGVAAVTAQVLEGAGAAKAWSVGIILGGMYLARGVIDAADAPAALRWLVPLEWGMLVRPFAGERWWVLGLLAAVTGILIAVAFALEAARDHGAGLRVSRPGPDAAPAGLSSAWGLATRLQRMPVTGWAVALITCALLFGSVGTRIEDLGAGSPAALETVRRMGGTDQIVTAFYVAMLSILVAVIAVMAASTLNRLRTEESAGRAEVMLSTATDRTSYALSHLVWALLPPAAVLVASGAVLPLAGVLAGSPGATVGEVTRGAAGLLPGLLLVVGIAMLVIGWRPNLMPVVWTLLGWSLFTMWFAALFDLPQWLLKLQPWGRLAFVPRDPMAWTPFVIETLVALALLWAGLAGYRRRGIVGH